MLQAATGRFNCPIAAFNGASRSVVTTLGRWKLFIVPISFCIACSGVRTVQLKVAGLGSLFPAVSTALTAKVCCRPATKLL
jgi:hypothetical protein